MWPCSAELGELRRTFRRKAYVAALEQVCRDERAGGRALEDLDRLTLSDIAPDPDLERLIRRRRDLGLPTEAGAFLVVDDEGCRIPTPELAMWLRRAQTVRVNIEGNGALCRGLLRTRYHLGELEEQLVGPGRPVNQEVQ